MAGFSESQNGKSWDLISDDIKYLLNHSDCNGLLTVEECKKVIPRLTIIVNSWDNDMLNYDKKMGLELIRGMELAVSKNKNFDFM